MSGQHGRYAPGSRAPLLSVTQILAWADDFHARTGAWPNHKSGQIRGARNENWGKVENALRIGLRGLPGGSSLRRLLADYRQVRHPGDLPNLTIPGILRWADSHHRRTGRWPNEDSGPVAGALGEKWASISEALRTGRRGLPGGSSLARLLAQHRGVRNKKALPPLTTAKILSWADAYHRRTGAWPNAQSGPIAEAPGETWSGIHAALTNGSRGLRPGPGLSRFLHKQGRQGVRLRRPRRRR
jgi:hypothetical protein